MAEMAKTDEGAARLARMNERIDQYVAERVEEGDQHAPQGGIAGNASHVVPLPEIVPFDPVVIAMRAASSSADAAVRPTASSADIEFPPPDAPAACPSGIPGSVTAPDDAVNEAPSMDLDLINSTGRVRHRWVATQAPELALKEGYVTHW